MDLQIAQDLTISDGAKIVLSGGALPEHVFWQVSGLADLGTTAQGEGVILSQTSITLHTGASVEGRLLAQTAVAVDSGTVVEPAEVAAGRRQLAATPMTTSVGRPTGLHSASRSTQLRTRQPLAGLIVTNGSLSALPTATTTS